MSVKNTTKEGEKPDDERVQDSHGHPLMKRLELEGWKEEFNPDPNKVKVARKWLNAEYKNLGRAAMGGTLSFLILLGISDLFVPIDGQIYGLSLAFVGSILMVYPNLRGADVIASVAERNPRAIQKLESESMVYSNTGFLILAFGFALQIWAVQTDWNGFESDILAEALPTGSTVVLICLSFLISAIICKKLLGFSDSYPDW